MQVPADPRSVKNMSLKIGDDNYELHANSVKWSKNTQALEWKGGTPEAVYSDSVVGAHLCNINLVHDYQNEDSLFNVLIDREGEQAEIGYRPDAAGSFIQTATITLVAADVGADVGTFGESTITCPSTKPVRTFTPPTP